MSAVIIIIIVIVIIIIVIVIIIIIIIIIMYLPTCIPPSPLSKFGPDDDALLKRVRISYKTRLFNRYTSLG